MRHSPVAKQSFGGLERLMNPSRYFFVFRIRNFVTPIVESVRTPARITPYPTGRLFWGGAVPGTSCQATIASSLRDIYPHALASANHGSKSRSNLTTRSCSRRLEVLPSGADRKV